MRDDNWPTNRFSCHPGRLRCRRRLDPKEWLPNGRTATGDLAQWARGGTQDGDRLVVQIRIKTSDARLASDVFVYFNTFTTFRPLTPLTPPPPWTPLPHKYKLSIGVL